MIESWSVLSVGRSKYQVCSQFYKSLVHIVFTINVLTRLYDLIDLSCVVKLNPIDAAFQVLLNYR